MKSVATTELHCGIERFSSKLSC